MVLFMVECKTRGETLNSPVCKVLYFYYFSLISIVHIYFTYKVTNSCIQSSVFLLLCKYKVLCFCYFTLIFTLYIYTTYKVTNSCIQNSVVLLFYISCKCKILYFCYFTFNHTQKKVNQLHRVAKMNLSVQGR